MERDDDSDDAPLARLADQFKGKAKNDPRVIKALEDADFEEMERLSREFKHERSLKQSVPSPWLRFLKALHLA